MQNIIKELEAITRLGYSTHTVFIDWLDLMLYALTADDENYLAIVKSYDNNREKGRRPIDHFTKAFALLMVEMQKTNNEILGEIYMILGVNNMHLSQYFTPAPICDFMARIVGSGKGNAIDPACGTGAMLIARAKITTSEDLYDSVFYGQDIDYTCVKMTALNMLFFNLNGFAICGNTLAFEARSAYQTVRTPIGGMIKKLSNEEVAILQENMRAGLEKKSVIPFGGKQVDFKSDKKRFAEEQLSIF